MMENPLSQAGNIPFTTSVLASFYPKTRQINDKARRLEQQGRIIRLKRGLFVRSADDGAVIIPFLIANHLYGPSYVSMHTALRHYGLLPERVYLTQSMTIKHSRSFDTPIGRYSYYSCPTNYFPIGIQQESQEGVTYLIATPEKALCDLIIKSPGMNATTVKSLRSWLADDLRFDMEAFNQFNINIIERCALQAPAKNNVLSILIKLINHE